MSTTPDTTPDTGSNPDTSPDTGTNPGDAGTGSTAPSTSTAQADLAEELAKWRGLARKHEETAKKNADKAKRFDALEAASQTELERAVAAARAEERTNTLKGMRTRIVAAEVRAAAGGKLADPGDAVRLLDLEALANEEGDVDAAEVSKAIDKLVKEKPYLAAKPTPDLDGGARQSPMVSDMDSMIRRQAGLSRT